MTSRRSPKILVRLSQTLCGTLLASSTLITLTACSESGDPVGTGGASSGGAPATGGANASGGTVSTGGQTADGGGTATGGTSGDGSGGEGSGGEGSGGEATGGGDGSGGAETGTGGGPAVDDSFAAELDELFVDVPCDASTRPPLAAGATCQHSTGTQRIERQVEFGGESGTNYAVKLRVRGIWEPTNIAGGTKPDNSLPLTVGGMVASGNPIDYQQYSIRVSEPPQTYWLNNYGRVAHEIFKEDYEVTLIVRGGSTITITMNDGNERQIANFPGEFFNDVPPYNQMPSLGQSLRLDVLQVDLAPTP